MRATYERGTKKERDREREREKEREREERDASRPHQHVNRGELRRARHAFTITRREAPRRNLWRRHTGPLVARRAYLSLSFSLPQRLAPSTCLSADRSIVPTFVYLLSQCNLFVSSIHKFRNFVFLSLDNSLIVFIMLFIY